MICLYTLLVFGLLAIPGHQEARDRVWQTTVNLPDGSAVLHWRGVYEGKDAVTRIDILNRGQRPVLVDVEATANAGVSWSQPTLTQASLRAMS